MGCGYARRCDPAGHSGVRWGAVAAKTQTKGERPDVTEAVHLGFGAEKNISFSVSFRCRPGEQPVIVGIGTARQYIPLTSGPCL